MKNVLIHLSKINVLIYLLKINELKHLNDFLAYQ